MLERLARHDALTNLPNRSFLLEQLKERLQKNPGNPGGMGLVADRSQRLQGDQRYPRPPERRTRCCSRSAPRLQKLLRPTDALARLGGDEFGLMLTPLRGTEEAEIWAKRVIDEIHRPFELDGITVQIDASVGIALHPLPWRGRQHAHCAAPTCHVCRQEKPPWLCRLPSPELDMHSPRQLSAHEPDEEAMRLEAGWRLSSSPRSGFRTETSSGSRALIRWHQSRRRADTARRVHPAGRAQHPDPAFTLWVIEHALMQCRLWQDSDSRPGSRSTSRRATCSTANCGRRGQAAGQAPLTPDYSNLKSPESAIVAGPGRALDILTKLA